MQTVTQMLETSASSHGNAVALRYQGANMSYQTLLERAQLVAVTLNKAGQFKEEPIGIFMDKSFDAIIAIYGALYAKGCYVPFDCSAPAMRLASLLRQCQTKMIITSQEQYETLLDIAKAAEFNGHILVMDGDARPCDAGVNITVMSLNWKDCPSATIPFETPVNINSPAAILFTSGSTGTPKGVVITHKNIGAFTGWVKAHFSLNAQDKVLSHAPLFFDLSLLDIFSSLAAGATVVLLDKSKTSNGAAIISHIEAEKITLFQTVPSVLKMLSHLPPETIHKAASLRWLLFAGEQLPVSVLKTLTGKLRNTRFCNIYGCTETNDTFCFDIPENDEDIPDELPIGSPLPYVDYLILDEQDQPAGEGELCVDCPTVMKTYFGENSAENDRHFFLSNQRYYRTRDKVKRLSDGRLKLCGRLDHIVKINGYRISLLEIEKHLQALPGVQDAAVIDVVTDQKGRSMTALVIPKNGPAAMSSLDLRRALANVVPSYMLPATILIRRESFTLTASGKIDRNTLRAEINRR